ncbi:MAG: SAM-dependent chlorinase/fluorinase [Candidatus Aenigmarchaeota archaeon]|nr:SAM-dependent chlorinase/fluorinase [Candidatus Aenigmarchaeota archaeon]
MVTGCNHYRITQPLIALLTDFGNDEAPYLIESAIHYINPRAAVRTITNNVPVFNILCGAWRLFRIVSSPTELKGNIYVCVVDPGVGSERECIIVKTKTGKYLVGPNNGVLSLAFVNEGVDTVIEIRNDKLTLLKNSKSNTFHGKDIFGPVAGYISNGVEIHDFGVELPIGKLKIIQLSSSRNENSLEGVLVDIDSFGSLRTNIPNDFVSEIKNRKVYLSIESTKLLYDGKAKISETFSGNSNTDILLVPSSTGYLDIVVNTKNAASILGIKPDDIKLNGLRPHTKITLNFEKF